MTTLANRALEALQNLGAASFDVVAASMGECPRRVRDSLHALRKQGHITVAGQVPRHGRGRPRALFAPRPTFALQRYW